MAAHLAAHASGKQLKRFNANLAKARSKDSLRAFTKLTQVVDGQARFISDPPLIVPLEELISPDETRDAQHTIRELVRAYRRTLNRDRRHLLERFKYSHMARKVVGVGSVGTRAWLLLLLGNDQVDPLILQLKEAQTSVLEPFLGKSEFRNAGQRVVEGQRLTQAASDIMLGWLRAAGLDGVERDFYVRQLWDGKGSALVELMNPSAMKYYAGICGRALAKGHARSGDATAITSYLGKRRLRPRRGVVRRDVRRPERARLRRAARRRGRRQSDRRIRPVTQPCTLGGETRRLYCSHGGIRPP